MRAKIAIFLLTFMLSRWSIDPIIIQRNISAHLHHVVDENKPQVHIKVQALY